MNRTKMQPISEQLRVAILSSDKSRYRIAVDCRIGEPALSRFVNGKGGLSLDTVDRIGAYLNLTLEASESKIARRDLTGVKRKSANSDPKRTQLLDYLKANAEKRFRAVELLTAAGVEYPKRMLKSLLEGQVKLTREGGYWWYQAKGKKR